MLGCQNTISGDNWRSAVRLLVVVFVVVWSVNRLLCPRRNLWMSRAHLEPSSRHKGAIEGSRVGGWLICMRASCRQKKLATISWLRQATHFSCCSLGARLMLDLPFRLSCFTELVSERFLSNCLMESKEVSLLPFLRPLEISLLLPLSKFATISINLNGWTHIRLNRRARENKRPTVKRRERVWKNAFQCASWQKNFCHQNGNRLGKLREICLFQFEGPRWIELSRIHPAARLGHVANFDSFVGGSILLAKF